MGVEGGTQRDGGGANGWCSDEGGGSGGGREKRVFEDGSVVHVDDLADGGVAGRARRPHRRDVPQQAVIAEEVVAAGDGADGAGVGVADGAGGGLLCGVHGPRGPPLRDHDHRARADLREVDDHRPTDGREEAGEEGAPEVRQRGPRPGAQRRQHPVGEAPEAFPPEGDTPALKEPPPAGTRGGRRWRPSVRPGR
jgi:hypothetical protein